jgi:hypothetical protein
MDRFETKVGLSVKTCGSTWVEHQNEKFDAGWGSKKLGSTGAELGWMPTLILTVRIILTVAFHLLLTSFWKNYLSNISAMDLKDLEFEVIQIVATWNRTLNYKLNRFSLLKANFKHHPLLSWCHRLLPFSWFLSAVLTFLITATGYCVALSLFIACYGSTNYNLKLAYPGGCTIFWLTTIRKQKIQTSFQLICIAHDSRGASFLTNGIANEQS